MKKIFYLLLALPLFLVSCDDDDDLPKFDVQITFAEGTNVKDNVITIEQGTPLQIESIIPTNYDAKKITFGPVTYSLDYGVGVTQPVQPFGVTFNTDNWFVGKHLFEIRFPVFAVDYSICMAQMFYTIVVTEPAENPDDPGETPDPASRVQVVTPSVKAQ